MAKKKVEIYTDGACLGNPGAGGYGVILRYKGVEREISAGFPDTTNNRMELTAAIEGLCALREPCIVELYSDSKYLVDGIEKGWAKKWRENGWMRNKKEKALNADLWERLLEILDIHEVSMIWVKGHDENEFNNRCDRLAVAAAAKEKEEKTAQNDEKIPE